MTTPDGVTKGLAMGHPPWVVPRGRVRVNRPAHGPLPTPPTGPPPVRVGTASARVLSSSREHVHTTVPVEAESGPQPIVVGPDMLVGEVLVGEQIATGIHQVDN